MGVVKHYFFNNEKHQEVTANNTPNYPNHCIKVNNKYPLISMHARSYNEGIGSSGLTPLYGNTYLNQTIAIGSDTKILFRIAIFTPFQVISGETITF